MPTIPLRSTLREAVNIRPQARWRNREQIRPTDDSTARPGRSETIRVFLASLLSGAAIAVAWWYPETFLSAVLGWVSAVLLVYAVRARRAYLPSYVSGLVCCALGFYWIFPTVSVFGGLGVTGAALVFALFVTLSAVQFLLFAFIHHNLGPVFDAWALRSPCALVLSELVSVRLFHWHFGHTQIALGPFVQIAGIGGAMLVSFVMFWVAEVGVRTFVFRERRRTFLVPLLVFALCFGYGDAMIRSFSTSGGQTQQVVLVQGNARLGSNSDPETAGRNVLRLYDLSRATRHENALIVWSEGAIPAFLPAEIRSVWNEPSLPWFRDGSAFLVGSYAMDRDGQRYNAAFAVDPGGKVPQPYFKQILIPFGEYMPLASVFPWLKSMNAKAGVFTAGTELKVFAYPMHRKDAAAYTLKVTPLICYEDTVPALARQATRSGAELLVNLTYDTWFGRSVAPLEHHLIAAFRAIENRRYLVRVTNNGLSAVVDPLGRTIARIPPFTEGIATARVRLLNEQSPYTRMVGEKPWWGLLAICLPVAVVRQGRAIGRLCFTNARPRLG
jgi:apolipoprotein N-acyltransferase